MQFANPLSSPLYSLEAPRMNPPLLPLLPDQTQGSPTEPPFSLVSLAQVDPADVKSIRLSCPLSLTTGPLCCKYIFYIFYVWYKK
ncbi:hypothetical protein MA16_Dca017777 [Dendrobium catenatum]|uniref:Uncharacterized protein n=1 Tax=Dendrobium catenatum TaxID=906689 RepID=A0A2I0XIH5_9ASPA|nr:hypothetical protein MA16_Dca017777 [Dendrobium catenatum]